MSRGLASAITDELASGKFSMAHLISIETNATDHTPYDEAANFLYTDAPVDIKNTKEGVTEKFLYRVNITEGSITGTMEEKTKYGGLQQFHEQVDVGFVSDEYYAGSHMVDYGNAFPADTTLASKGDITYNESGGLSYLTITFSEEALRTTFGAMLYFEGTPLLSYTYKANGFIMGLDGVTESSNLNIGSLTLGVSSVNQTLVSDMLANGHLNRRIKVRRAFLDSDNDLISNAVFQVYSGRIEGMSIKESGDDSMMELSVANHWADFERDNGRQTNNTSQQHHFDGDLSMEFAPQTGKKLLWGEIESQPASMIQRERSTRRSYRG